MSWQLEIECCARTQRPKFTVPWCCRSQVDVLNGQKVITLNYLKLDMGAHHVYSILVKPNMSWPTQEAISCPICEQVQRHNTIGKKKTSYYGALNQIRCQICSYSVFGVVQQALMPFHVYFLCGSRAGCQTIACCWFYPLKPGLYGAAIPDLRHWKIHRSYSSLYIIINNLSISSWISRYRYSLYIPCIYIYIYRHISSVIYICF